MPAKYIPSRQHIHATMMAALGSRTRASEALGLSTWELLAILREYGWSRATSEHWMKNLVPLHTPMPQRPPGRPRKALAPVPYGSIPCLVPGCGRLGDGAAGTVSGTFCNPCWAYLDQEEREAWADAESKRSRILAKLQVKRHG